MSPGGVGRAADPPKRLLDLVKDGQEPVCG